MDETLRRDYLEAMGIQNWVLRRADEPELIDPNCESIESRSAFSPTSRPEGGKVIHETVTPERLSPDAAQAAPAKEVIPPWLDEAPPPTDEWLPSVEPEEAAPLARDIVSGLDWKALEQRIAGCELCELHKTRAHTVFGVGDHSADLMVIGEAPGAEEDRQGEPFVGRAGQLLNAMLLAIGLKREQVFIANVLKCRPPGNRDPRPEEALSCEPYLKRQVALIRPKVILALGRVAAQNLLKSQEAVGRMRGKPYRYDEIPLVVTYHPAYLQRSPDQKGRAWQDLQRAVGLLRE